MTIERKKLIVVLAVGLMAIVLYRVAMTGEAREEVSEDRPASEARGSGNDRGNRVVTKTDRDQALGELKAKWNRYFELKKSGGDQSELHRMKIELAEESASRLLTSRQALD